MAVTEYTSAGTTLVDGLAETGGRLDHLLAEAAKLDEHARALNEERRRLAALQAQLEREAESLTAHAVELSEREDRVAGQQALLEVRSRSVQERAVHVEELAGRLAHAEESLTSREARFRGRWRWLVRSWRRRRFRRNPDAQLCEVLFVPTRDGYRLLEQAGLAVSPGSVLTGLIEPHRRFVVTKIAPQPFETRLCAYLQEIESEEGSST